MRSHSVTCHPAEVTFPPLPQPKLVFDLATPEGCKAELTLLTLTDDLVKSGNGAKIRDIRPKRRGRVWWEGFIEEVSFGSFECLAIGKVVTTTTTMMMINWYE